MSSTDAGRLVVFQCPILRRRHSFDDDKWRVKYAAALEEINAECREKKKNPKLS